MFNMGEYVMSTKDIKSSWIFENYLSLGAALMGQRVVIKSIFNPKDKTPSLSIYYAKTHDDYRYKCFSTGHAGDGFDMLQQLWNLDFQTTFLKVKEDYAKFLEKGGVINKEFVNGELTWKVKNDTTRKWNVSDANFWSVYNIGSTLLEQYNVRPLQQYTMYKSKEEDLNEEESFVVNAPNLYGYYTKDDTLYKIYRPMMKPKFIKVCDYLQGLDQNVKHDFMIICSSLKDILSLKSLGVKANFIAPESENTILSDKQIETIKNNHKAVITIFDNDDAGIRMMKTYQELFNIPFAYIPLSKDISDSIKNHDKNTVLREVIPRINKALDKYELLNTTELIFK
jgi:5S rRNA maturation endonuclease (ribonuclease M5)